MVWWKILLRIVLGMLLVFSVVTLIASLSFSQMISYNNLKPTFKEMFKEQWESINDTELEMIHFALVQNCTETGSETIEVPLEETTETITLTCSDLIATTPQELVNLTAETIFDKIYYKEYDESITRIIISKEAREDEEKMLVLFSDFASKSFKRMAITWLIIALIIVVILLFLDTPKSKPLIHIGTCFMIVGLSYFSMMLAKTRVSIPEGVSAILLNQFFSNMSLYFITSFIVGLFLLGIGLVVSK